MTGLYSYPYITAQSLSRRYDPKYIMQMYMVFSLDLTHKEEAPRSYTSFYDQA